MTTEVRNILLVEDDKYDQELTLIALKEISIANEVVVVSDGQQALDYLLRENEYANRPLGNPAVVMLDLKMPKIDGIEVLRTIRSNPNLKNIPIIILTSSREEPDIQECYELGVNAYVVKPVDFKQFIDSVKEIGLFWAVINQPPPYHQK